nr:hypothetical protein [Bradyrhizobium sp. 186]
MKQPPHVTTAEERFADAATRLREQAEKLPPGHERDVMLRKASLDEAASHMFEWLNSPGLRPPT